jgi:serine/threonine-protein kinase
VIGQSLLHYRLLDKLGEGGMGVVYRAVDTRLDREVAIKVLAPEAMGHPERKRRFIQEARTASALNHPNIITIYDIGAAEAAGRTLDFIAMEYVKGRTLYETIGPQGLPLTEALRYGIQVASALEAAHAVGIIHRDLKPANIMVTAQGLVKVLDFGVAKLSEPEEPDPNAPTQTLHRPPRTTEGTVVGTVAYMSPEQAEGKRVDVRSDLFSFGSMFYEMLTGQRAFQGDSRLSIMASILRDEPGPGGELSGVVPLEVEPILARCLRKDPERRFQSAADLKVVLQELWDLKVAERVLPTATTHRIAPAGLTRKKRALPRKPLAAVGAAALLLVLAAAAWVWRDRFVVRLPERKHIAVLPFQTTGGEPAHQAFADGLVEMLAGKLAQLERFHKSLSVVGASEVRREGATRAPEARRAFGVNLVIQGRVERPAGEVRVMVSVVEAPGGRVLGSRMVRAPQDQLPALPDALVRAAARLLQLDLTPEALQALSAGYTSRAGAYDLYLQALGTLQRYDRAGNIDHAIALFSKAAEQDPNYALAYAGLGEAYWRQYSRTREPRYLEQARSAGRRALQLDDRLSQAFVNIAMTYEAVGQHDAAVQELERALRIDPGHAAAYRELATVYLAAGRPAEAEATYRRALQLRPGDWLGHTMLGLFYLRQSRYAEAETPFQRAVELTPDNAVTHRNLGGLYYLMGRYDLAAQSLERSVAIQPLATSYSNLGVIHYALGRYRQSVAMHEKALELAEKNSRNDYLLLGNLADAYRWTPELADQAPATYRRAVEAAERHLAVNPDDPKILSTVAVYRAKLAENRPAVAAVERARRLAPSDAAVAFRAAVVYELANQRPRALTALQSAVTAGYSLDEIRRDPELAQLRRDPRFEGLLQPQ